MTADFVLAGTGSRSLRAAQREVQVEAMRRCTAAIEERHTLHGGRLVVMSGLAEGWDELIALTALRLGVRLWAAIPNRGYGAHYWGRNSVTGVPRLMAFREIVSQAWKVTHVMEDIHQRRLRLDDGTHANFVRNDYLVEQADEFLVWDPSSRGTAHCVAAIKRVGTPFTVLSDGMAA